MQLVDEFRQDRRQAATVFSGVRNFGSQVVDTGSLAIKSTVDARVKVSSDDTADCHCQHAVKSNRTIDGCGREIAVIQDEQWADQAKNHVNSKPVFYHAHSS